MIKNKKKILIGIGLLTSLAFAATITSACNDITKKQEQTNDKLNQTSKLNAALVSLVETKDREKAAIANVNFVFDDQDNQINLNSDVIISFVGSKTKYKTKVVYLNNQKTILLAVNDNKINQNQILEEVWINLEKDYSNLETKTFEDKKYYKIYTNQNNKFFVDNQLNVSYSKSISNNQNIHNLETELNGNQSLINAHDLEFKLNWSTNNLEENEIIKSEVIKVKDSKLIFSTNLINNRLYNLLEIKTRTEQDTEFKTILRPDIKTTTTLPSLTKIIKYSDFIENQNDSYKLRFLIHSNDEFFVENQTFSLNLSYLESNNQINKELIAKLKNNNDQWVVETELIKGLNSNTEYTINNVVFGNNVSIKQKPSKTYELININLYDSLDSNEPTIFKFTIPSNNNQSSNDSNNSEQNNNQNHSNEEEINNQRNELEQISVSLNSLSTTAKTQENYGTTILERLKNHPQETIQYFNLENTLLNNNENFNYSFNLSNAYLNDLNGDLENITLRLVSKKYEDINNEITLKIPNLKTRVISNPENIELYKKHFASLVLAAIIYNINKKENSAEFRNLQTYENQRINQTTNNPDSSKNFVSFNRLTNTNINDYFDDASVNFNESILTQLLVLKNQEDEEKYYLDIESATASDLNGTLKIGYTLTNKSNNSEVIHESITLHNFIKLNQKAFKSSDNQYFRISIIDWLAFRKDVSKKNNAYVQQEVAKNKTEIDLLARMQNLSQTYWNRYFAYSIYGDMITNTNYSQNNYHEINEYETIERNGIYPLIYYSNSLIEIQSLKVVLNENQTTGKLIIQFKKNLNVLDDDNNLMTNFSNLSSYAGIESEVITQEINVDLSQPEW